MDSFQNFQTKNILTLILKITPHKRIGLFFSKKKKEENCTHSILISTKYLYYF